MPDTLGRTAALRATVRDQIEDKASNYLSSSRTSESAYNAARQRQRFLQLDICATTDYNGLDFDNIQHWSTVTQCSDSEVVAELFARILGLLSEHSAVTFTARFLPKLNKIIVSGRQTNQAVALLFSLRYMQLIVSWTSFYVDVVSNLGKIIRFSRNIS